MVTTRKLPKRLFRIHSWLVIWLHFNVREEDEKEIPWQWVPVKSGILTVLAADAGRPGEQTASFSQGL